MRGGKANRNGFGEGGRLLLCSDSDGLGIEREPSRRAQAEKLAVPFVLIGERFCSNEPLFSNLEGEVELGFSNILGAYTEVKIRRGKIEWLFEVEGKQRRS